MKTKTGWHYTSWENWLKIRKEGLIPYRDEHWDRLEHMGCPEDKIIYVYDRRQRGLSLFGILLWHSYKKATAKVVCLRVDYRDEEAKFHNGYTDAGGKHDLHSGCGADGFYHKAEPFTFLSKRIPPKRIELIKVYDLAKIADSA